MNPRQRDRAARALVLARMTNETARSILDAADRAAEDAALIQQMAQMIRDMGAEYCRALTVMDRVRQAHSLDGAQSVVNSYLAELGR